MKKIAIYPGTFDPITNGHLDIIKRASHIFDTLLVAVAKSTSKSPCFDLQSRTTMVQESIRQTNLKNVFCESFDNLLADLARQKQAIAIIRGLRVVSDFEYELQMGYANLSLNPKLETMYFMPSLENAFISSSIVRNIFEHQGKISHLVPKAALEFIQKNGYVCM